MNEQRDKGPVQQTPRQPLKDSHPVADRVKADKPVLRKPTGPVIYTIEKGANVWPGLK